MAAAAGRVVHGYTLVKLIGAGGYAAVYKATNAAGELVAIKEISSLETQSKSERDALYGEVALLSSFDHPNIIRFYEWFEEDNNLYIAMEFARLGDMQNLISRASARASLMAERTIWKLFYQIASGLRYLHERRVMHRDIKPANVFVFVGGLIKLGDLGVGRTLDRSGATAMTVVGTPVYMSPERITESAYSLSSDIWAMGVLLYELAALRNPFLPDGRIDIAALIGTITRAEYAPLPADFSPALRDLVSRCLVVDPAARPTADDLYRVAREAMERFMASGEESDA